DRRVSSYALNLAAALNKFALSFRGEPVYADGGEGPVLDIWVARGREWVQRFKQLAEEEFTPNTGIHVRINTVPAESEHLLLLSYTADMAPDIMLGVDAKTPVEFALRGAATDLTGFIRQGQEDLASRFASGALI